MKSHIHCHTHFSPAYPMLLSSKKPVIIWNIFSCAYWLFYILWRNVYSSTLPIFKLNLLFFYIFWKLTLSRYRMLKHFLSFCKLSFYFLYNSHWCIKGFNFDEGQFTFFLLLPVPLVSYLRNYCLIQSHKVVHLCFS